jgi:hypothetical protein
LVALLLTSSPSAAGTDIPDSLAMPSGVAPPITCIDQLRGRSCEELLNIFAGGNCACPSGYGRGEVVLMTDGRHCKMKMRMTNRVWKGKVFDDDGSFTNQWVACKALHSCYGPGPSWYDGLPCIVMEYPPHTPLFANSHDEIRQVGPGIWLGMFYERDCKKLRGFFALECAPAK